MSRAEGEADIEGRVELVADGDTVAGTAVPKKEATGENVAVGEAEIVGYNDSGGAAAEPGLLTSNEGLHDAPANLSALFQQS